MEQVPEGLPGNRDMGQGILTGLTGFTPNPARLTHNTLGVFKLYKVYEKSPENPTL